jgi:hypothetical protein
MKEIRDLVTWDVTSVQHGLNSLDLNCVSLSIKTHLGTPNLKIIFFRNLTVVPCMMLMTGSASIHMVNVSIATNRYLYPSATLVTC